jgi:hypothetical protein
MCWRCMEFVIVGTDEININCRACALFLSCPSNITNNPKGANRVPFKALIKFSQSNQIIQKFVSLTLSFICSIFLQVWFQNRRAKFRKQERLAQQKVSNSSSASDSISNVKSESKSSQKDIKPPGSPLSNVSNVSTTPNSSASSSHLSNSDIKPINGN